MIEYKHVALRYTDKNILKDVNLRIENGEFMVLVGPSGSGKTTMIKMVNRLLEPTDGNIYMDGKRIKDYDERELRLSTGYVLQAIALFPNLTVAENIALIPEMKGWSKEQIASKTEELLAKVGLPAADYAHRLPSELSGGEQQRIGIVRAIIGEPKILLMDEPFSALDAISRKQLQALTKELHKEFGMTTIFVTHDTDEALKLGDRIAVLQEGEIVQVADSETILAQPANDFVADLFGGAHHVYTTCNLSRTLWGLARCTGATFATVITDLAPCDFSSCSSSYLFEYPQKNKQLGFTDSWDLPDHSFHGSFGPLHSYYGNRDASGLNSSCHLCHFPDPSKYHHRFTGD